MALGAPAFLSGLTDANVGIVKAVIEKKLAPDLATAKADALRALSDAERGWRNAASQLLTQEENAGCRLGYATTRPAVETRRFSAIPAMLDMN